MNALRDSSVRRLSVALAGLALYLQLAFAGPGMLALAAPSTSFNQLDAHALCLAGGGEAQPQPADNAPGAPAHDHTLFCCLGHLLPGVAPQAASTSLPVSYAAAALVEPGGAALVAAPRHKPANARAPPTLA